MTTRLIDTNWSQEIMQAIRREQSELRVVSPFIKTKALTRLLAAGPQSVRVVKRYCFTNFAKGVSDLDALHRLIDAGRTFEASSTCTPRCSCSSGRKR